MRQGAKRGWSRVACTPGLCSSRGAQLSHCPLAGDTFVSQAAVPNAPVLQDRKLIFKPLSLGKPRAAGPRYQSAMLRGDKLLSKAVA
uniref:Bm12711 n=1 Tax=Brugia malayi TaxID=6279 RepID=A0A1I9GBY9_BRUMA|nr:Bm12711 [Brugia malayi]